MQEVVANVADIKFDVEIALERQLGALPLPFPGMDSKYLWFCYTSPRQVLEVLLCSLLSY